MMRRLWIPILWCLMVIASCSQKTVENMILFDFETDGDLDALYWKCRTLFSLSDAFSTHGSRSLKMEMYPAAYPGVDFKLLMRNWRSHGALCLDMFNAQDEDCAVTIRIDDVDHPTRYDERYNKRFILHPGENNLRIPLETLVTSGAGRKLNLNEITNFLIFQVHPKKRTVMYIDYIRLESAA